MRAEQTNAKSAQLDAVDDARKDTSRTNINYELRRPRMFVAPWDQAHAETKVKRESAQWQTIHVRACSA